MSVRYNPLMAYLMLGLGIVNIGMGLWSLLLGDFSISLLTGLIITVLGVGYLNRPYFQLEQDNHTIIVPALYGPVKRTFAFNRPEQIRTEENKIMVQCDGRWQRVPVYRWMSHSEDWKGFIKEVQSL